eukprot:s1066_g13.t1
MTVCGGRPRVRGWTELEAAEMRAQEEVEAKLETAEGFDVPEEAAEETCTQEELSTQEEDQEVEAKLEASERLDVPEEAAEETCTKEAGKSASLLPPLLPSESPSPALQRSALEICIRRLGGNPEDGVDLEPGEIAVAMKAGEVVVGGFESSSRRAGSCRDQMSLSEAFHAHLRKSLQSDMQQNEEASQTICFFYLTQTA